MIVHLDQAQFAPLMKRAAWASVFVASVLIVAKGVAWHASGSVALLGSLVDSTLDLTASLINLLAVTTALAPPDEDHRFGHGKAEPLAGLFQSMVIMGSVVFLAWRSIVRLIDPQPLEQTDIGIMVSVFAIIMTIGLVVYQSHVVSKTKSVAISADSLHYKGDLFLNMAVIAALLITSNFDLLWVDGAFGLLIAAYVAYSAWEIMRQSIDMLMDKEFDDEERDKIIELVMGNPDVKGMHDLKTRRSGLHGFIQFHVELDPDMNLRQAHAVADEVEATVGEHFPHSEILIHTDPFGLEMIHPHEEVH